MLQTLFYIPTSIQISGVEMPLMGFGLLLAVWAVFGLGMMAWLWWRQGLNSDTLGYVPLLAVVGAVICWVLPAISEEAGLPIRTYGVMMLIAAVSGTLLAAWRAKRVGLDPEMIFSLAFWMIGLGVVGARAFYVIQYWDRFLQPTFADTVSRIIRINEGGLVVYGSFFGAVLAITIFVRRNRLPLLPVCDLLTPSIMLGLALGRIGCLCFGCCYGGACDLPWKVTFPHGSPAHFNQVLKEKLPVQGLVLTADARSAVLIEQVEPGSAAERSGIKAGERIARINSYPVAEVVDAQNRLLFLRRPGEPVKVATENGKTYTWAVPKVLPRSRPIHPTQIYSAIGAMLVFAVLMFWSPRQRRDGELFALLITVYPVTRFILEMIRTDELSFMNTGMTISQNVSLLMLICAAALWLYILSRPGKRAWAKQ